VVRLRDGGVVNRVQRERGAAAPAVFGPVNEPHEHSGDPGLLSRRAPGPALLQIIILRNDGATRDFDGEPNGAVDEGVSEQATDRGLAWLEFGNQQEKLTQAAHRRNCS